MVGVVVGDVCVRAASRLAATLAIDDECTDVEFVAVSSTLPVELVVADDEALDAADEPKWW